MIISTEFNSDDSTLMISYYDETGNIAFIKKHNIDRGSIHNNFEKALVRRKKEIENAKREKEITKTLKEINIKRLNVGDIFVGGVPYNRRLFLVIQKTPKSYYCVKIEIESESETHYTLTFRPYWNEFRYDIKTNEPILEVVEPIKPPKCLILKNKLGEYNEAEFNHLTKKRYFMLLFGYTCN